MKKLIGYLIILSLVLTSCTKRPAVYVIESTPVETNPVNFTPQKETVNISYPTFSWQWTDTPKVAGRHMPKPVFTGWVDTNWSLHKFVGYSLLVCASLVTLKYLFFNKTATAHGKIEIDGKVGIDQTVPLKVNIDNPTLHIADEDKNLNIKITHEGGVSLENREVTIKNPEITLNNPTITAVPQGTFKAEASGNFSASLPSDAKIPVSNDGGATIAVTTSEANTLNINLQPFEQMSQIIAESTQAITQNNKIMSNLFNEFQKRNTITHSRSSGNLKGSLKDTSSKKTPVHSSDDEKKDIPHIDDTPPPSTELTPDTKDISNPDDN